LSVDGVGYKAEVQGQKLILSLGYSHIIELEFPETIKVSVEKILLLSRVVTNKLLAILQLWFINKEKKTLIREREFIMLVDLLDVKLARKWLPLHRKIPFIKILWYRI